jgi:hypothetical protein
MPAGKASSEGRLLLVSNRLPITIKRSDEGKYDFSMSSGGLVSGLSGLSKSTTFQWYGWPGLEVPENEISTLKDRLKEDYNAVPIMLDDELADRHYNGFSSRLHPSNCPIGGANLNTKIPYCGLSSIIILARLPSTNLHGLHIPKRTVSSRRLSPRTFRTTTWSGFTTTTSC